MGITEKGKKGFLKKDESLHLTKRVGVYLSQDEYEEFKEYCKAKNQSKSNVLRSFILHVIQ